MVGMARAFSTSLAASDSMDESTPRMTPRVRRWRTRARVSRSETTGMPALAEECVGFGVGAPVARDGGEFAHREAFDIGVGGFVIAAAGSVIADLGVGEDDDLAGIGRIGENFLIAGERGVEDHFARRARRAHQNSGPRRRVPSSRARIAEFNLG